MKRITCIVLLLSMAYLAKAQKSAVVGYAATDKKMLLLPDSMAGTTTGIANYINANFTSAREKARAAFIWVVSNIRYDLDNMFAINFYEKEEDRIAKALKSRKGICANFAAVFNDICRQSGLPSFVVTGYTRQSGFTDYIPHAWCATRVDSAWYIFDPTWGSGYVANGKFISRINNFYCMADPAIIIKSHMPFDYLWQFLNYPVSNQAFYDGKTAQNKSTAFFNYADSLITYEKQDTAARLNAAASRIEKNGIKNSLIFDRLQHIKLELEYYRVRTENQKQQANIDRYNLSVVYYNDGINYMNDFIQYRNKQFTPEKPDEAIRAMLDTAAGKIDQAAEKLSGLTVTDANTVMLVEKQQKAIGVIRNQLKEQQDWLTLYFSKSKSKRKAMFYEKRTTVFGIPVN